MNRKKFQEVDILTVQIFLTLFLIYLLTLFGVDYKAHLKAVRQFSISDVRQDPNYDIYRPLVRKN